MNDKPKTCLNCLYEPDWPYPKWTDDLKCEDYPNSRQYAKCKFDISNIKLPEVCVEIHNNFIERYIDDSGIYHNCQTWEPKE